MRAIGLQIIGQSKVMAYQSSDYVATHTEPVWRDKANFLFRVPIDSSSHESRWEQLWWTKLTDVRFVLCCIPFFVYDLALGDEVEIDGQRNILSVKPSGQRTFRIWFGGVDREVKAAALEAIRAHLPSLEWSSDNLLAISVDGNDAQSLANTLESLSAIGQVDYETGTTLPKSDG
jgi:hypothetical protein